MEARLYCLRLMRHPSPSPTTDEPIVNPVEPEPDTPTTGTVIIVTVSINWQLKSTTLCSQLVNLAQYLYVRAPVSQLAVLDWCILRLLCGLTTSPLRVGLDV
jgi:hypothetical protein